MGRPCVERRPPRTFRHSHSAANMISYEAATLVALVTGPVVAVVITLWHQQRSEKRAAKARLFQALMANRKILPPPFEYVGAVNLIDVVFADEPGVVGLWHEVYDILCIKPVIPAEQLVHKNLELLSAMAASLGYSSLKQTDIDKFYFPEMHNTQAALSRDLQTELLRVLKASKQFGEGGAAED